MFLASVALFVDKPVKPPPAAVASSTAGLLPPPNVAVGVTFGSLNPLDSVRRHSNPALNACRRTDQLTSSPALHRGLMPSRHRPNWPRVANGRMPVAKFTVPIGMPLEFASNGRTSAPTASPRSAAPHCQLFEPLLPRRSWFNMLLDNVEVNWML